MSSTRKHAARRLVVGGAALLALGWLFWRGAPFRSWTVHAVPEADLSGADPLAAAAIATARSRVLASPRDAELWGELGMMFMAHRCDREALAAFDVARELGPGDFRWSYLVGVLLEERDLEAAVRAYDRAERIRHGYAPLQFRRGRVLFRLDREAEAEAAFLAAAQIDPRNPLPRLALGRVFRARGDLARAREELLVAAEVSATHAETLRELASIELRLGHDEQALAAYERAARLPASAGVMHDPVLSHVEQLEAVGRRSAAHADELAGRGNLAAALVVLTQLTEDHPHLTRAWLNRGLVLHQLGRLPEAEAAYRAAMDRFPGEAEAYYGLGTVLESKGDHVAALRAYREALHQRADYAEACFARGVLLERLGHVDEAIAAYRQAVVLAPDFAPGHLALGVAYRVQGEFAKALTELELAVELAPGDPVLQRQLEITRQHADEAGNDARLHESPGLGASPLATEGPAE